MSNQNLRLQDFLSNGFQSDDDIRAYALEASQRRLTTIIKRNC